MKSCRTFAVVGLALVTLLAGCSSGGTAASDDQVGPDVAETVGEVDAPFDVPGDVWTCTTNEECEAKLTEKDPCQIATCDAVEHVCKLGNMKNYTGCDDSNLCTDATYCLDGVCGNGLVVPCDDGNVCTDDKCDPATGCGYAPNTAGCDDGNECTANDKCAQGVCVGSGTECPCETDADCPAPADLCSYVKMACVEKLCKVQESIAVICDASLDTPCEKNACVPETGECDLLAAADGTACNDGTTCTVGDKCLAGACVPGENKCTCATDADCTEFQDGNKCNGTLVCTGGLCAVKEGSVVTCSQTGLGPCQVAVCNPADGMCKPTGKGDGTSCTDGDDCTTGDKCQAGNCKGQPKSCDDGNPCTADSCKAGQCGSEPLSGKPCDDGDACTTGDSCQDGVCVGGENTCGDCGDGQCIAPEDCATCPKDCGACQAGDCCESKDEPGCSEQTIQDCVCGLDTYCCETAWDDVCVGEAVDQCGLKCGTGGCGDGACGEGESCESCPEDCGTCGGADPCKASDEPGCGGCEAEACVCKQDPFCCQVSWDQWCVGTYVKYCNGECPAYCGDGVCDEGAGEDCTTCDKDCGACPVVCGDGLCDPTEDCKSCEQDCGPCPTCGDGQCVQPETCETCPADCGQCGVCGDGKCAGTETCQTCEKDCGKCIGTCQEGSSLVCGGTDSYGLTQPGTTSKVTSYSCNKFTYSGPEYTYKFQAQCDGVATVTLTNETSATDVMVLVEKGQGCDPSQCVAYGLSTVSFDAAAGNIYYLVVDGFQGANGNYTIGLSCECGALCGNGLCEKGEDCLGCPNDCGPCTNSCCSPHDTAGCDKPEVQECVCAFDPYCCDTMWDGLCVQEAQSECKLECPAVCGDGVCQAAAGETCTTCEQDCGPCPPEQCTPSEAAGCGESLKGTTTLGESFLSKYACNNKGYGGMEYVYAFTAACDGPVTATLSNETGTTDLLVLGEGDGLCAPYNCVTWGVSVVSFDALAGSVYYLVVDGPAGKEGDFLLGVKCACGQGACCQPSQQPGCEQKAVEACVCAMDPYCCNTMWDIICVNEAVGECGLDCGGVAKCGDGQCTEPETCQTCPQDCGACCGNQACEAQFGEDCTTCPQDCGACPGQGSCCIPNGSTGCKDKAVEACVCKMDPYCCQVKWDSICAAEADQCGSCTGDCCAAHANPGCDDEGIEACICAKDLYCCTNQWDGLCASEVEQFQCGSCGNEQCGDGQCTGSETCQDCPEDCGECCGNGACEAQFGEDCTTCAKDCGPCPGEGSCCVAHDGPGCKDATVQACVCKMDPYCCQVQWDSICAAEADECGSCTGDCCQQHANPGCDDEPVESCVCAVDGYCCDTAWDGICAGEVESLSCGSCGGDQCGDGECTGLETCATCEQDCGKCCGNGTCDAEFGEDCASCEADCGPCEPECQAMFTLKCGGKDSWDTQGGQAVVNEYSCVGGDYSAKEYVYAFTATCTTQVKVTLKKKAGVNGYLDLFLLDPECKGSACKAYAWMGTDTATMLFQSEKGKTYFIAVDGYNGAAGAYDIAVDCTCPVAVCGNQSCDEGETCVTCPQDCGSCPGSCCIPNETVGCANKTVQDCVCKMDPFCCNTKWDSICAAEADQCGSCTGDCCTAHANPGCDDEGIEQCVCAQDSFCCNIEWDGICAGEVESLNCGSCGAAKCGDGQCNGTENCSTCPQDCGKCCGNGQCEGAYGETCTTCPQDCGACPSTDSCCLPHDKPGCKDQKVQACVCAADPYCCAQKWDSLCAAAADQCGSCNGDCCKTHANPGCDDEVIEQCVCAKDAFCCNSAWDGLCVGEVTSLKCGTCQAAPVCGDNKCTAPEDCKTCPQDCGACPSSETCCLPHASKGCKDAAVQGCVCKTDPYCCNTAWDETCAAEADACGSCMGDCCKAHANPGCDDEMIEECVCEADPYCCDVSWDSACAGEVTGLSCGQCGGAKCGDGTCAATESCQTCPQDCGNCCGNAKCEAAFGENCTTCPQDCGACPSTASCCLPHDKPGCATKAVQDCVCAIDPYCCNTKWDSICAGEADQCGSCNGDCCKQHANPGCDDESIEQCVCPKDPFCCNNSWDSLCASEVTSLGCGQCGPAAKCGNAVCEAAAGETCASCPQDCGNCCGNGACEAQYGENCSTCAADCGKCCGNGACEQQFGETCGNCPQDCGACQSESCCLAHDSPGCSNKTVQDCVCKMDPFCCNNAWDMICAGEADQCGSCMGDCCKPHGNPGCDDEKVEACVCAQDMYCCTNSWDNLCVSEVTQNGCGACGNVCGDGLCTGTESCSTCALDCGQCCGNGQCQPNFGENCSNCPGDCGKCCGNGTCEAGYGETCSTCPQDCGPCPSTASCCIAHNGPGCKDAAVQKCVCAMDPFCCNNTWDSICAAEADQCGSCTGDCCKQHANPGCDDENVEACVCAKDAYCCDTQWDAACASEVTSYGCGTCALVPKCGDGACNGSENCSTCPQDCGVCCGNGKCESGYGESCKTCAKDCGNCSTETCCLAHNAPGCGNAAVQDCVCAKDPFCCWNQWDAACAAEADDCGSCNGDCCTAHANPGCADEAVEACVCKQDPFCCNTAWDGLCANEVTSYGCGTCIAKCGDGKCTGTENCSTCPGDCGKCCGNGVCDAGLGENCSTCAADCGNCCGNGKCEALYGESCTKCPKDCGTCSTETCCLAHAAPGCGNAAVMECVCAKDTFCCTTAWDSLCAAEADGCGSCGGSCCAPHATPGCSDQAVEACVCKQDKYCCDTAWDMICVGKVSSLGCGTCAD